MSTERTQRSGTMRPSRWIGLLCHIETYRQKDSPWYAQSLHGFTWLQHQYFPGIRSVVLEGRLEFVIGNLICGGVGGGGSSFSSKAMWQRWLGGQIDGVARSTVVNFVNRAKIARAEEALFFFFFFGRQSFAGRVYAS